MVAAGLSEGRARGGAGRVVQDFLLRHGDPSFTQHLPCPQTTITAAAALRPLSAPPARSSKTQQSKNNFLKMTYNGSSRIIVEACVFSALTLGSKAQCCRTFFSPWVCSSCHRSGCRRQSDPPDSYRPLAGSARLESRRNYK